MRSGQRKSAYAAGFDAGYTSWCNRHNLDSSGINS